MVTEPSLPVGVFDSGVGGLTVLNEVRKQLPNENIIYLAHTACLPIGVKPPREIAEIVVRAAHFFAGRRVKAMIVACNSATSYGLEAVAGKFYFPILGVIVPGARGAVKASRNLRIGVIGTEATVKSGAYEKAILNMAPGAEVFPRAVQIFSRLVEDDAISDPSTYGLIREGLSAFEHSEIDTLVLGCTHYPPLIPIISDILGQGVVLVNPACETVRQLASTLARTNLLNSKKESVSYRFCVTEDLARFIRVGNKISLCTISDPEEVKL